MTATQVKPMSNGHHSAGTDLAQYNEAAVNPAAATAIMPARTFDENMNLARVFAASGYFADAAEQAQAMVKILAGQELGLPPIASMQGIHIIKGKPCLSSNLMAGAVKRSGRYDYRVVDLTDERCEIAFYERAGGRMSEIGQTVFTRQDAIRAGTQNLGKFPRNMLFARAMSNGVRFFCPDVFYGPTYVPEEFGFEANPETGEVSAVDAIEVPAQSSLPVPTIGGARPAPQAATQPAGPARDPRDEAWLALINTPGWIPAPDDLPAVADFLSELFGRKLKNVEAVRTMTAEHFTAARDLLERRRAEKAEDEAAKRAAAAKRAETDPDGAQRRRFYAVLNEFQSASGGEWSPDGQRAYLGAVLRRTVESRADLTPDEWGRAADALAGRLEEVRAGTSSSPASTPAAPECVGAGAATPQSSQQTGDEEDPFS